MRPILMITLIALMLSACGQSGPLYLPDGYGHSQEKAAKINQDTDK